jgi:hypothetical protein
MKIKTLLFFVGILTVLTTQAGGRGGDVGNGGDSVYCTPAAASEYNGYYNLDFLLTRISTNSQILAPVSDVDSSLHRIGNLLSQHSPDLADSFLKFQKYLNNHSDYLSPQLWSPARYGLISISDEHMINLLPSNCLAKDNSNQPQIIQTVIRRYEGALLKYYYDSEILAQLPALQLSFLYVHEWLWSFVNNPESIRNINLFLHSQASANLTHENFMAALNSFGLSFHSPSFKPLCALHPSLKINIESLLKTSCESFSSWNDVTKVDLKQAGMADVTYGEFGLFSNLQTIDLSSNEIKYLFPSTFLGNMKLSELNLEKNNLKSISKEHLRELYSLRLLNMKANQIQFLPMDLFSDQKAITINLENNEIQELDLYSLNVSSALSTQSVISLNLVDNKIQKITAAQAPHNTTFRTQYHIDLGNTELKEVNIADFIKELKLRKSLILFNFFNYKNIDLLKSQGLNCVMYTGTSRYECDNR